MSTFQHDFSFFYAPNISMLKHQTSKQMKQRVISLHRCLLINSGCLKDERMRDIVVSWTVVRFLSGVKMANVELVKRTEIKI